MDDKNTDKKKPTISSFTVLDADNIMAQFQALGENEKPGVPAGGLVEKEAAPLANAGAKTGFLDLFRVRVWTEKQN